MTTVEQSGPPGKPPIPACEHGNGLKFELLKTGSNDVVQHSCRVFRLKWKSPKTTQPHLFLLSCDIYVLRSAKQGHLDVAFVGILKAVVTVAMGPKFTVA
jgi:hypothetical protein